MFDAAKWVPLGFIAELFGRAFRPGGTKFARRPREGQKLTCDERAFWRRVGKRRKRKGLRLSPFLASLL